MLNIIILGSSGMIGNLILEKCLQRKDVNKITLVNRKASGNNHPKIEEVLHDNFLDFEKIKDKLTNQDICFFCVGVYTGAVPRDEFRKITVDYTEAFAKVLRQENEKTAFCFLSGQGADQKEKSRLMFAKDKGIAENILQRFNFSRLHIFRPSYIYPSTPRMEPGFLYRMMRVFYPFLNKVYHYGVITSAELATVMVDVGFNGGEKVIYENKEIRQKAENQGTRNKGQGTSKKQQ